MRKIEVDERCPDLLIIEMMGIIEQCGKKQYFNALIRTSRFIEYLTQCAVDAVNGREPTPGNSQVRAKALEDWYNRNV